MNFIVTQGGQYWHRREGWTDRAHATVYEATQDDQAWDRFWGMSGVRRIFV